VSKRLLCRLGIHETFTDTTVADMGEGAEPRLVAVKVVKRCNHCDWSDPRGA